MSDITRRIMDELGVDIQSALEIEADMENASTFCEDGDWPEDDDFIIRMRLAKENIANIDFFKED